MTLEWIEYLAKKTPLEEKIDALSDSFEKIVEIFLKMSESFDQKVSGLHQKISMLIENIQKLYNEIYSLKQNKKSSSEQSVALPPPANLPPRIQDTQKTPSKTNDRRELINELERLFKKKKGK